MWVAVPTNIICGLLLPIAYVGFIMLQRSRAYLGEDKPTGKLATVWILAMILATVVLVVGLGRVIGDVQPGVEPGVQRPEGRDRRCELPPAHAA